MTDSGSVLLQNSLSPVSRAEPQKFAEPYQVDRIIFCVFLEVDYKIFKKKMGEFFPLVDANEEGTELSEETGLEQKGQPPSPTESKAEQPEDLQDDAEGGNSTEEKQNTEETEAQSREADETKPSAVASLLSSEETELSEDKDSLKDFKGAREGDPAHPAGCQQDQAQGQPDVSAEEVKTGADSQSSCMELEEPLLNQEDTTEAEIPLSHGAVEKEEGKEEGGGGVQGKEETPAEPMKVDPPCEAADVSNKDAEMNITGRMQERRDPRKPDGQALTSYGIILGRKEHTEMLRGLGGRELWGNDSLL
ncbi:O-acetyl-ADP-ribose deacetylase MACROD2 [Patagioenas fasciata monilis]|uniref:O-acetyl-ADP-ribose deacetylase MACROD2 n=1 Tax=Patagioenas fasciata monilis TaxID=372326 RepID=A0A1V4IFR9_PATFA|nr:O-acetyl-ADP-ribose deacetylase MACROD2 [Patagioenas fasciata monilis]